MPQSQTRKKHKGGPNKAPRGNPGNPNNTKKQRGRPPLPNGAKAAQVHAAEKSGTPSAHPGAGAKIHRGRPSNQAKAAARLGMPSAHPGAGAKALTGLNFPVLPSKQVLREEIVNKAKKKADILNKLANVKLRANANEFVPPQSINKVNKEKQEREKQEREKQEKQEKQEKEKQKPEIERAVAVDCEMIKAGEPVYLPGGSFGAPHVLAQVVIVDFNGKTLLDRYVLPEVGVEGVVNYLTKITGINYNTLKGLDPKKHSREVVIKEVKDILKDRIIVGHQLSSDFKALDYNPEENNNVIFDTAKIDTFMNPEPNRVYGKTAKKLKDITKQFVGYNIQNNSKPHDPLEDAIAPMNIFRKCLGYGLIK